MANVKPTKLLAGIVRQFDAVDTIGPINGGTGIGGYVAGDLLFAADALTLGTLAAVSVGNVLLSGGIGSAPVWGQLDLSTSTTGILPVIRGGTGLGALTVGNYVNAATSSTLQQRTPAQVINDIGAAPLSHEHTAGDITSGVFDVLRLGTGVHNAGTFLRGDGVFSTIQLTLGNQTLSYGSATNTLSGLVSVTAGSFVGPLTGNASSATVAGSATVASTLTITNDNTSSLPVYLVWAATDSGNLQLETSSTKLSFLPATGVLSATSFNGAATLSTLSATGNVAISSTTDATSHTTGAMTVAGGVGIAKDAYVGGNLIVRGITYLGDTVGDITEIGALGALTTFNSSTASTSPNQIIATVDALVYRSCEFRIQAVDAVAKKYHTATILVVHNSIIADYVEFGDICINGMCGTFSVDFFNDTFRLRVTPDTVNLTTFKIVGMLTKL